MNMQAHVRVKPLVAVPKLQLYPAVEALIWDLVINNNSEIGWLGSVLVEQDRLIVDQIFAFEQEVTDSFNSLKAESLRLFWRQKALAGERALLDRMMFWGHSHGQYGPFPSEKDRTTMKTVYAGKGFPYVIMGIFNHSRQSWFSIYDYQNGLIFDNVKLVRDVSISDAESIAIEQQLAQAGL